MVKARFYIEDKVQGVGYRPFIIEMILDSDLEGTARNLPDGRIEVLLEGKKSSILEFIERLKREKPELAENPSVSEADFDADIPVPEVMRSSQALILGQFGKGVVVLNDMKETQGSMKETQDSMKETQDSMKETQDSMLKNQDSMIKILKEIRDKL